MDLETDETLRLSQNNVNEKEARKRRRLVDCDEYLNVGNGVADEAETADYFPAAKFRGVDVGGKIYLTDFPDELLYEIFKNLDSWTHHILIKCCTRFATLLMDRRFWQHIDLSEKVLPIDILDAAMKRSHKGTESVKLRGPSRKLTNTEIRMFNKSLEDAFTLRCTNLSVLELRGVTLDLKNFHIVQFPKMLKRLVFRNCDIRKPPEEQTIFSGIHTHLVYLEELGIEFSSWFEPYHIMMISKIPALRWLSLKGCKRFAEFIPYGGMAARFGFKKLEYLDLRFTPLNDSDLQCFNVVLTLKELLLDCPVNASSYCDARCDTPTSKVECESASSTDCHPSTSKATSSPESGDSCKKTNSSPNTSTQEDSEDVATGQQTSTSTSSSPQLSSSSSSSSSSSFSSLSSTTSSSSSAMSSPLASPSHLAEQPPADDNPPEPAGNVPSRSRFLPRPDQVILLDFVNRRPTIRHIRPLPNMDNQMDGLLQHPLFWNIINPLGRGGEVSARTNASVHPEREISQRQSQISDRGICSFGRPQHPVGAGIIWIRIGNRPSENSFVRLSVRNYKRVTDISLHHLVQCSPDLVFLDLSGTSVTREGVERFKAGKPECQIIADHLIMPNDDEENPNQNLSSD